MLKHNVLDEITARLDSSVKHWNDIILFWGFQCSYLHLPPTNCNVRTDVGAKFYKHHVVLNLEYPLLSIQCQEQWVLILCM
ncbi:hypothetical protein COM42_001415 [Wolbachia pipientis]|uniref:Uncharacterized protein n=1 Tax=Wolbachia pipientis TaxID=955 RepID=A0A6C1U801_WOLPI|nr:hypothetical protein COM42_001415 [Wolbachia pipientis]